MNGRFGSAVLETACRLLVPFVLLYALYVVAHGHTSPGGGFQGGTILAAAVILIGLLHGREARWTLSLRAALALAGLGTAVYAGIGLAALASGGGFLDYGAIPLPLAAAQVRALSTLVVESSVAIAVMGVMTAIFHALAGTDE
jgi:multicomponent Na+:H+ antiporter subunit B